MIIKLLYLNVNFYVDHDWWKYFEDVINFHVQWSLLACVNKGAWDKTENPYTVKVSIRLLRIQSFS